MEIDVYITFENTKSNLEALQNMGFRLDEPFQPHRGLHYTYLNINTKKFNMRPSMHIYNNEAITIETLKKHIGQLVMQNLNLI